MPQGNIYSRLCNANVNPAVFVKVDAASQNKVIQAAAATDYPIGISQESAYLPPIPQQGAPQLAGAVGSPPIRIYGVGCDNVLLQIGVGGCTAGDRLTSDANGNGVVAVANNIYCAIANETRVVGEWCRVSVVGPSKA